MSLRIYTKISDIPDGLDVIDYNDKFFAGIILKDDEVSKQILKEIDQANYNSKNTFIGRDKSLGALNKSFLSTGCKTLLNIISKPEFCFNVIECGQNALKLLAKIHDGNIFWKNPVLFLTEDEPCDIIISNNRFTKFMDFTYYIMDILPEEEDE